MQSERIHIIKLPMQTSTRHANRFIALKPLDNKMCRARTLAFSRQNMNMRWWEIAE